MEPSLIGTSGLSATDGVTVLRPAANQYEICFKCHASSSNKPQNSSYTTYGPTPYRQTFTTVADPYNVLLDLQSAVARHNVTQPSRGNVAPSLRPYMLDLSGLQILTRPLTGSGLYLYCTDCHNSDAARISNGTGPNGPHGSAYFHLLERQYEYDTLPTTPGAVTTGPAYSSGLLGPYAICDKCHNLDGSLLTPSADVAFGGQHYEHVVTVGTSCATCHASHGIQGGTSVNNANLVNFDTTIVGPVGLVAPYIDTGAKACYLTCHGVVHGATMTY